MDVNYTVEEKVRITAWAISDYTLEECRNMFTEKFNKIAPPRQTISYWRLKLLQTGSLVADRPRSGRPISASGDDTKDAIVAAVTADPTLSTRRLSDQTNVSHMTVQRVLKKSKFHPYKPMYCQFICDADDDRRLQFCHTIQQRLANDPAFLRKITFSDECVFSLTGHVNKHNVHYWAIDNPHVRFQNPGKTPTLTVWACVAYSGLVSFDISHETMNSDRYCNVLNDKVIPYFSRHPEKLYQQDGAPPHYSINARAILDKQLAGRWIGRRGPIEWPARSPDLSVCDYWLWAYLRSQVYTNGETFRSVADLRAKITEEIENIPMDMYRRAFKNFPKRLVQCVQNHGGLFE